MQKKNNREQMYYEHLKIMCDWINKSYYGSSPDINKKKCPIKKQFR